jgi:Tfp pilus assembly PilM family ATPase
LALRKKKDISSTEKLLDVIRNKKTSDEFLESPASPPSEKSKKLSFLKVSRKSETISVGVDIGYHQLRFIKVAQSPENQWRLLDYSTVPFRPDVLKGTPEFAIFLRAELDKFCGYRSGLNLWANMSSARVEISAVRIPKVAKKQIENAVYWTVKKNVSFNEKETIFDFEIQDEVIERGITKLAVMACAAPKQEVQEMRDLFESAGYPLDGLTIAPFAIQNLFRTGWIPSFDQTVATLYIGRDWSRIDIFSKGVLVMTRGIKTGINSMIQELKEWHNESVGSVSLEESQVEETSETTDATKNVVMETEDARELLFSLSPDFQPSTELRARFGLNENSIFKRINPALDRLVRQVERTFQHYTVTLGNESVSAIYVSTTQNVYRPIVNYIGDELGIESDILDPLEPENPSVGEMISDISVSDRVSFGPVIGVALSDLSRTPNLLFTYKEKERQSSVSMINRAIFTGLVIVLACSIGALLWLGNSAGHKRTVIAQMEQQLNQTGPISDEIVSHLASKVEENQKRLKKYSDRYLGVAAISELSALTPSNIRLLHISADMGLAYVGEGKKAADGLTIEGIVSGDIKSLESSLVGYVLKLQSSPMFNQAKINKSKMEPFGNKELLRFTLNVKFI